MLFFQNSDDADRGLEREGRRQYRRRRLRQSGSRLDHARASATSTATSSPTSCSKSSAGQYALWQTNGQKIVGGGNIGNPGRAGPSRRSAISTATGSATSCSRTSSGDYAIWDLNGTSIIGGGDHRQSGPGGWRFAAAGDFNGDGTTDILFQNASDVRGLGYRRRQDHRRRHGGSPGSSWTFKGAGDFNGDGKSDLLFENTSGTYATWDLSGNTIVGGGTIGNPGIEYGLRRDRRHLRRPQIIDTCSRTHPRAYETWNMNDTTIVSVSNLGTVRRGGRKRRSFDGVGRARRSRTAGREYALTWRGRVCPRARAYIPHHQTVLSFDRNFAAFINGDLGQYSSSLRRGLAAIR